MTKDTRTDGVPEHVTRAAEELRAAALRLLPEVFDLADRYERLDWMLDELPAEDEPGGEVLGESEAMAGFETATIALGAMGLKLDDVTHSLARPEQVAGSVGFEIPEYQRLMAADRDRQNAIYEAGRRAGGRE